MHKLTLAALAVSLFLVSCGGATQTVYCCVNKQYYSCGSTSDVDNCQDACTRDSSKDDEC